MRCTRKERDENPQDRQYKYRNDMESGSRDSGVMSGNDQKYPSDV